MSVELFPKGAAVVAGGSGGIGRGICECLAEQGSDIAILYRSKQGPGEALVAALVAKGVRARAWQVDLQDAAGVASVMAEAAEVFGRIHTAVYASGPAITINFLSRIPPEEFARIVSADVLACYNFVHAALAPIKAGGGGALIGITTDQLDRPELRGSMSSIPKAAVDKMFQVIAKEEARHKVRAASVRAGWVDTGLGADVLSEEARKALIATIPAGHLADPREIGEVVAFLASSKASYVTGVAVTVDGGHHL